MQEELHILFRSPGQPSCKPLVRYKSFRYQAKSLAQTDCRQGGAPPTRRLFGDLLRRILLQYEGECLAADRVPPILKGEWPATVTVILRFPSKAQALACTTPRNIRSWCRSASWCRPPNSLRSRGDSDQSLMAVAVETEPTFAREIPEMLFDLTGYGRTTGRDWDVASDGQRFLLIKERAASGDTAAPPQIVIVQNWLDELAERVPSP